MMESTNLNITPTSSSSIIRPPPSVNSERAKKDGFKQQFKRLIGWNSSVSSKKQTQLAGVPPNTPPQLITLFTNNNQALDTQSPSDMSFVSAPSTPFPPTPGTPRSIHQPKSRQGSNNHLLEVYTPVSMSPRPSETNMSSSVAESERRVSSLSSQSSASSTSSVTSQDIAAASQRIENEEEEEEDEPKQLKSDKDSVKYFVEQEPINERSLENPTPVEDSDIQTQYAMWMNSQTNTVIPEETPIAVQPVLNPASHPKPPIVTTLRHKSSIISNVTTHSVPTTPSQSTTLSPSSSTITNKVEMNEEEFVGLKRASTLVQSQQVAHNQPLHPMSSNNQQGEIDDLFLLVAHGVEFLTMRESTKWEEEGGYDFHPWNRPESSFAVRHKDHQNTTKSWTPLDTTETTSAALAMARSLLLTPTASEEQQLQQQQTLDESSSLDSSSSSTLDSPVQEEVVIEPVQESPSAMARRILGAKHESPLSMAQQQQQQQQQHQQQIQPQQHQSLNDDELQRIVASHIVF